MRQLELKEGDAVILKLSVVRHNPPRWQCAQAVERLGVYRRTDKWGKLVVEFGGTTRRLEVRDVNLTATKDANRAVFGALRALQDIATRFDDDPASTGGGVL